MIRNNQKNKSKKNKRRTKQQIHIPCLEKGKKEQNVHKIKRIVSGTNKFKTKQSINEKCNREKQKSNCLKIPNSKFSLIFNGCFDFLLIYLKFK